MVGRLMVSSQESNKRKWLEWGSWCWLSELVYQGGVGGRGEYEGQVGSLINSHTLIHAVMPLREEHRGKPTQGKPTLSACLVLTRTEERFCVKTYSTLNDFHLRFRYCCETSSVSTFWVL